jgi:membrane protein
VLPLFLVWMHLSWYTLLFGAAIAATLPRLRATRFSDELRPGNNFITAVALLKVLLEAKAAGGAVPTSELARRVRTTLDETELLLERLERLGYVRRLAATRSGRRNEQDWLLTCDPETMNLRPAFERFAVDPTNTLLGVESLGLGALAQRWSNAEWLTLPLAQALAEDQSRSDSPELQHQVPTATPSPTAVLRKLSSVTAEPRRPQLANRGTAF